MFDSGKDVLLDALSYEGAVMRSDGERRIKVERERTTLGRSRDADIFIPDQWLSRMHAEILLDRGGLVVADLGSKNGTLVNGSRIQGPTPLRKGDQIKLGDHTVTVQWSVSDEDTEDEPAQAPALHSEISGPGFI